MSRPEDPHDPPAPEAGHDHASRLRHQIDRGGTGDKVSYPDPAAAPLGTDDEAAGTPLTSAQVRLAEAQETTRGEPQPARRTDPLRPTRLSGTIWVALLVALVLIGAAVLFL